MPEIKAAQGLGTVLTMLPEFLILYVFWAIVWINMAENRNCLISPGEVFQCLTGKGGVSHGLGTSTGPQAYRRTVMTST
jgi:hypothetical protein